jgi:hypothetical protein
MRSIQFCLVAALAGCSGESAGPPLVTPEQRMAIKQNLAPLKARLTSDSPDGLYLSLRNTHVQILEAGGAIESTPRSRMDLQDFTLVSEAVAKPFLETGEFETFKKQLRTGLSPASPSTVRSEFSRLSITRTRIPLRLVLALKRVPAEATP